MRNDVRLIRREILALMMSMEHSRENVRNPSLSKAFLGMLMIGENDVLISSESFSPSQQMLTIKRRSQPIVRSSSVHDLNRHEVYRANELDFGPIIGQGFYGIARTVDHQEVNTDEMNGLSLFVGYTEENWSDNGDERNENIR